ncbi:histidine phosphatase family protein [Marinobacter nauticus]|uniref:histidine phosphatase family protein n=1 Tax=Marinobacter nauticus TaxID=2743 RepID=UPI001C955983|nr:histidine phosphatase family protein [Marinobacter nauticus]MBY6103662.1 histidine phosphatase family protein [Marinobacter nauticus]
MQILAFLLVITTTLAASPLSASDSSAWTALKEGRAVLMLRHALAPGTGDPAGFVLGDCGTQRNLNDTGRGQARAWKAFLAEHGIDEARVFSSQWCRCLETAQEMNMGPVSEWPPLNSFFRSRDDGPEQTRETIKLVNSLGQGAPVVMVSHQVNVTALTGIFPASNEGVILALPLSENPDILARVAPGQ